MSIVRFLCDNWRVTKDTNTAQRYKRVDDRPRFYTPMDHTHSIELSSCDPFIRLRRPGAFGSKFRNDTSRLLRVKDLTFRVRLGLEQKKDGRRTKDQKNGIEGFLMELKS